MQRAHRLLKVRILEEPMTLIQIMIMTILNKTMAALLIPIHIINIPPTTRIFRATHLHIQKRASLRKCQRQSRNPSIQAPISTTMDTNQATNLETMEKIPKSQALVKRGRFGAQNAAENSLGPLN
jgi:hypothetical protein